MPRIIHGPECPECNSRDNRVVLKRETDSGIAVRRRVCKACDHRWYGLQAAEHAVDAGVVIWARSGEAPVITDSYLEKRLANV